MPDNKKFLIHRLNGNSLDGRFENIRVVNCDPVTGAKIGRAGALSVVFHAMDNTNGQPVAIKFFDPDISGPALKYRLDLFERENELLKSLSGGDRTLQLTKELSDLQLQFKVPSGLTVNVDFQYLVTEWLEGDVERHFLNSAATSDEQKLELFRECCLAVFALHNHGIAHRDLKPDNFRLAKRGSNHVGVAIDLGTAAQFYSPALGTPWNYSASVGAPAYAPLEANLGLSGIRELGIAADYYALGCMLYELFCPDLYYHELLANLGFSACRSACERHMHKTKIKDPDDDVLLKEWDWIISRTRSQVTVPRLENPITTASPGILILLNDLIVNMTAVDYRRRFTNPDVVLRKVDSAMKVLRNHLADRIAIRRREQRRENRRRKEEIKRKKLKYYLNLKIKGLSND